MFSIITLVRVQLCFAQVPSLSPVAIFRSGGRVRPRQSEHVVARESHLSRIAAWVCVVFVYVLCAREQYMWLLPAFCLHLSASREQPSVERAWLGR